MKIVIPAAGEGVRLRPHTLTLPKPLLRLAGKRVIDFLLEPLSELEPSEIALVVGYRGDQLSEYVAKKYDVPITTVTQDQLLGLGYAVLLALREISLDEDLLIILADTVIQTDFKKFIEAGENTLALKAVDDPRRFGVANVSDGNITRLVEKPAEPESNLAVVGLYYFKDPKPLKDALEVLYESGQKTSGEMQLTDALAALLDSGQPFTPFEIDNWLDCGKRETLLSTNAELLEQAPQAQEPQAQAGSGNSNVDMKVWVHPEAEIFDSKIGSNVTLYAGARVVNSELSDCIVGDGAQISGSRLSQTLISGSATVSDCEGCFDIGEGAVAKGIKQTESDTPVVVVAETA